MKIAICEDEIIQQEILYIEIKKNFGKEPVEVDRFNSGEEILSSYANGNYYDIVFMDIRMKRMNGIESIRKIKDYDKKVKVIITTSSIEYAIVGYSVKVDDFILKPINENNLSKVLNRVLQEVKKSNDKIYVIENRNEIIKLCFNDIFYIESFGRKLCVYSCRGTFEHYRNISEDEKNLLNEGFVKVHRAYLVNMKYIYRVKNNQIIMLNNQVLPISRKRYQYVYDQFTNFVIGG